MTRTRTFVLVDSTTTAQAELGPIYANGTIGSWNGYHYNNGGAVVAVDIIDPAGLDDIDGNPLLTRLPSLNDPTPDAVKQKHVDKLHQQVKDDLKGQGKLDSSYKLNGNMSGREIAEQLHDLYKDYTKHFHPDF